MPGKIPSFRKRVYHPTKYPVVDSIDVLNEKLEDPFSNVEGECLTDKIILNIAGDKRQLWSPRMKFNITPNTNDHESGLIKGFVEPQPVIWTLFIIFYISIGLLGIIGSIYAYKKWVIEGDPVLLWIFPTTLVFLSSSYLISKLGLKLMHNQVDTLNEFIDDIIAVEEKKSIFQTREVTKFLGLGFLGILGDILSSVLLKIIQLSSLNDMYGRIGHLPAEEFLDAAIKSLEVKTHFFEKDLARIPKTGGIVLVSNHPTSMDGLILLREILTLRPDVKMLSNFLVQRLEPIKPLLLPVNPFENYKEIRKSLDGLKAALLHVKNGGVLLVFPAGEISMLDEKGETCDKTWHHGAIKLIKKLRVPVFPVYFNGKNTNLFYVLSKLNGSLRTAMLGRELLTKKGHLITCRIGDPISPKLINELSSVEEISAYIRIKSYWLKHGIPPASNKSNCTKSGNTSQITIAPPKPFDILKNELEKCKEHGDHLFSYRCFDTYLSTQTMVPNVLEEIGRQREITFREIGEGTNKTIDLDQYDEYYKHLFIIDNQNNQLVGAYRLGIGKDIYQSKGIKGFYLNELFKFDDHFEQILSNSIEMGRAFICPNYQRSPMGLFLLWKGICMTLLMEKADFIIGGVSISNNYSAFSKKMMIDFLRDNYFDTNLAKHVKARLPYTEKLDEKEKEQFKFITQQNIKVVDKLIDELEPCSSMKIPILFKKYISQNGKLIGFNIDPDFNNVVDGLMIGRTENISQDIMQTGLKEYQSYLKKNAARC